MNHNSSLPEGHDPHNKEGEVERVPSFSKGKISEREDAIRGAFGYFSSIIDAAEHVVIETAPHISSDLGTVGEISTRTCVVQSSDGQIYELGLVMQTGLEAKILLEVLPQTPGVKRVRKEEMVFTNGVQSKKANRIVTNLSTRDFKQESSPMQQEEIDALVFNLLEPVFVDPETIAREVATSTEASIGMHSLKKLLLRAKK